MAKKLKLSEALAMLDVNDTSHWNSEGLPSIGALKKIMQRDVTRAEVSEFAPEFCNSNPIIPGAESSAAEEGDDADWMDAKEDSPADTSEETAVPAVAAAPSPSAQSAEVTPPVSAGSPEDEDDISAKIIDKDAQLRKLKLQKDRVVNEIAKSEKELADLYELKKQKFPPKKQAEVIKEFIASQQAQRAAKVKAAQELKQQTGLEINTKAPIDAAMQRSTGYGHQRPRVPLQAQG